jgi:tetratricopeptide (TPR) repeat protein
MITGGEIENIENAFFKVIDEHTPFYQEIFQMLTGQQRRIFDVLISFGETATPKQISEKARIKLQTVNTQLRRLETDGYVISRPMGRHSKYEVRERLFRLWREMRQILLEFLQLWYTAEERKELFRIKFELLAAGEKSVLKELCYYAEIQPPEFKAEALLKLTPKLIELGELEEAVYEISKLKEFAVQNKDIELKGKIPLYEGQLLISENKYEEALKAFNQALEINPKDDYTLSMKGIALGNLGKYEGALEAFNQALEINPKNYYATSRKGVALINLSKYEEALEAFNQAFEINPKDDYILSRKGIALGNLGQHEEALEAFNQALEINPKDDYTLSIKGATLGDLAKHKEALQVFNQSLEINPKNDIALSRKGAILIILGKHSEALEAFNQALEINPKNYYAISRKGVALIILGKHSEALEAFNQAFEINPKDDYTLSRKGIALGNLGQHEEALEAFNQALDINPEDDIALSRKGIGLINLGKDEDALESLNHALTINPNNDFALSWKGIALINLGKDEDALESLNHALTINPNNDFALSSKGVALLNLGKDEDALESFNQALDINPNNDIALPNKGYALGNLGKHEKALESFNQALDINPKDENTLENKALALIKLERYEEGLETTTKILDVITKNKSNINIVLIMIEAYLGLDRKAEATLEIEKIKDTIADQEPDLIEDFTEICLNLALEELEDGNRGNADKFIKMAFENSSKLKTDIIKELTMNFLKAAADSGELRVIKAAAEEILNLQKDEFTGLIRPITKAIEIIETKYLNKYYDLQIEEREIVADVVKKITKSDELVPDEIKRKDSY